jgi:hypothetical protein
VETLSPGNERSDRNGGGRKITDTAWFESLANFAAVAQAAWHDKRADQSWFDAWAQAHDVSADRITEIGVMLTREAVRRDLRPQQAGESRPVYEMRLLRGRLLYFAGLADDVVDGARARVESGRFATAHGPLYDALSDRWRENRIVDALRDWTQTDFDGRAGASALADRLGRLKHAMGGPSVARAYGEALGYSAPEQAKGSALDRNLELFRLAMLVSRGRLSTAHTLAARMEADAVSLTRSRLALDADTPRLPARGRDRKQAIARRRFAALSAVMQRLTEDTAPQSRDTYWSAADIRLPVLPDALTPEESDHALQAVDKIMRLDQGDGATADA